MSPHPIPPTMLGGEDFYSHRVGEDTEAQRGRVTCPESHSWEKTEMGFEPRFVILSFSVCLCHPGGQ